MSKRNETELDEARREFLGGVGDKVLNLEEIGELLRVGRNTVLSLCNDDQSFPARKVGREWRASRNAVLCWLQAGGKK